MKNARNQAWRVWRAGPESGDALVRLELCAFNERSWGENDLLESFVTPGVTVLLAGETQDLPLGFAIIRCAADEAEILSIGTDPAARRCGVGRALLRGVIDLARSKSAQTVFLDVSVRNRAAITLYENGGFQEVSRRRAYYRDGSDAVIMAKDLADRYQ